MLTCQEKWNRFVKISKQTPIINTGNGKDKRMKPEISIRKTVITDHKVKVTGRDILKALGITNAADVVFNVPSGGDWSGMAIEITDEDPVCISWSETNIDEEC